MKDPVRNALTACEEVAQRAEALAASGKPLSDLHEDILRFNAEAIASLSTLENRLEDANQSRFAKGANWLDDFETYQNVIYQKLSLATDEDYKDDERRRALSEVKTGLVSLRKSTNTNIDAEIDALASGH